MLNKDKHREAGRSIFLSSITGFANVAAVAAAYFATGPLHSVSVGWINDYTATHYGTGLEGLVSFAWFALIGFATFFIARASLATLIMMGGLALASRLF